MNQQNIPTFVDKIINCFECYHPFTLTKGEQYFYFSKNLQEPKRCPACRKMKRIDLGLDKEDNNDK